MDYSIYEILQTIRMTEMENLDIRTVTMGVSLTDCADRDINRVCDNVQKKLLGYAAKLVPTVNEISAEYGIPVANKRLSVTPLAQVGAACENRDYVKLARAVDAVAQEIGVDFVGGFSALVHKGTTKAEDAYFEALPEALAVTNRLCGSVSVATTRVGINMDAIKRLGHTLREMAAKTAHKQGLGCAKFVIFANPVEDNPFMAGAFFGAGEPEVTVNVGVSGPGVVAHAVKQAGDCDLGELAEVIKRMAFKITRAGELIGREAAKRLNAPFGIIDLSLAPTPLVGDSVGEILQYMGLEFPGAHGSTAALALLTDAVKKGGVMASSYVGGLSGAFIPVSEDHVMITAAHNGALTFDKLEAMTSVCSVGLDMVVIPGDTPPETISGIIADEVAIGVMNSKTTAIRIIPAPGKKVGEMVEFGGLLGRAPVMAVNTFKCADFIRRGGRIPAPIQGLRN
ncbi:MAG: PFL family protein [Blastocatellia bacterium]|nr:PFL family protein [Blastocatellia bacterium]